MSLGRPREFDREAALEAAMVLFWTKGYEATSKRDLMEATGVASQSLYNAFGDKKTLFQESLDHYAQTRFQIAADILLAPGSPLKNLRTWVQLWADPPEEFTKGCLICNTLVEFATSDQEVSAFLQRMVKRHRELFLDTLRAAQAKGEIDQDRDIQGLASMLVSLANGISLMHRSGAPKGMIDEAVRGALGAF